MQEQTGFTGRAVRAQTAPVDIEALQEAEYAEKNNGELIL